MTASANKCLQGIPGIAFVLGRRAAVEALAAAAPRSVYLDLYGHWTTQEADNTPFTPAVQVLHAMRAGAGRAGGGGRQAPASSATRRTRACCATAWPRSGFEILVPPAGRSSILTTFRLLPGLTYEPLHDAMKRRGYIIYAGQGDIRTYAFRVSNMGTLTPADMRAVVAAFAACLDELGVARQG